MELMAVRVFPHELKICGGCDCITCNASMPATSVM